MVQFLFCIPVFGHGLLQFGMGFGNRLFPWARCRLFSYQTGARMISPIWFRPAIRQMWRKGVVPKYYLRQLMLLGLFKNRAGDVGPFRGRMMMLKSRVISERQFFQNQYINNSRNVVVVFRSFESTPFATLLQHRDFLKRELLKIVKVKYLDIVQKWSEIPLVMNIRCGNDFLPPTQGKQIMGHQKTSLQWFADVLCLIRRRSKQRLPALVVSDGPKEELRPLFDLEDTFLLEPRSAISDLLVMSKAKILLASGASSFSAWGSFLGNGLCISFPGQNMSSYWGLGGLNSKYFQVAPDKPHESFLRELDSRLSQCLYPSAKSSINQLKDSPQ